MNGGLKKIYFTFVHEIEQKCETHDESESDDFLLMRECVVVLNQESRTRGKNFFSKDLPFINVQKRNSSFYMHFYLHDESRQCQRFSQSWKHRSRSTFLLIE